VCPSHGGRAPQVRAKARERIEAAILPAIATLRKALKGDDIHAAIKAARDLLDRADLGSPASGEESLRELMLAIGSRLSGQDKPADLADLKPAAIHRVASGLASRDERVALRSAATVLDRTDGGNSGASLLEIIGGSYHPRYAERSRIDALSAAAVVEECDRLHGGTCATVEAHINACAETRDFSSEYWEYGQPTPEERRAVAEGRRRVALRGLPDSATPRPNVEVRGDRFVL
jgi:hypothetical protein